MRLQNEYLREYMTNNELDTHKPIEFFVKQLLEIDSKKVDLKFIFDHVRNYGIGSAVMVSGLYLLKHPDISTSIIPNGGIFWGIIFLIFGLFLNILNMVQIFWILANLKIKKIYLLVISGFLFFGIPEFFWIYVKQFLS